MTSRWGPSVWFFFHTMVATIKEDSFHIIGIQMLNYIVQISSMLPCQDCSNHAKIFFNKININHFNTKEKAIQLLYVFHNAVNKHTKKQLYPFNAMNIYEKSNIFYAYSNFIKAYNSNIPSKLTTDTFARKALLSRLQKWVTTNHPHFIM